MQTPKFLKDFKGRFLATGLTTGALTVVPAVLSTIIPQFTDLKPEHLIGAFGGAVLSATAPALAAVISGIALELFSGDFHEKLKEQKLYEQIPQEATLHRATFNAFRKVLDKEIEDELNKEHTDKIKQLRDISFENWKKLCSFESDENEVKALITDVFRELTDDNLIRTQFLSKSPKESTSFLTENDWAFILSELQIQENCFLDVEVEKGLRKTLAENFATRLQSVFSIHQESFQTVLLELQKVIITKLDSIEGKVDKVLEKLDGNNPPTTPPNQKFFPKNFPTRLTYFTGRNQVLENIAESLKEHGTASFADTHGVGKSSVVIEFAHRRQADYQQILFIRATNNEFDIYVSDILKSLGFDLPNDATPAQRLLVFQDWLAKNQNWLLIVDNVDDVEFIQSCNFNLPSGFVIYTSNDNQIHKVGAKVDLPKMLDENAMLLLYKHWKDAPNAEFADIPEKLYPTLKGIAEKFGNHPFSMAFVGSYLAEEQESLDEFLETYQSKAENLLEKYEFLTNYQHQSVAKAFLLRFEQISTPRDTTKREEFLSVAVKDYLKLSAFIGTDNIPEELLQQSLAKLHPDQSEWTDNEKFIKDIYKRFKPTSIFKRDADAKMLTTHRIVQEIMRFQIGDEEDLLLEILADGLADNFEFFDFTNLEKVERYLSQVGIFLEFLENNKAEIDKHLKLENKSTALLCNNYALYFKQYGQYKKAEKYFVYLKDICEKVTHFDETWKGVSYNNLGELYQVQGRFEKAELYFLKALAIFEKVSGENHPNTAVCYDNLAVLYKSQGSLEKAKPFYLKSLLVREKFLGKSHPHTVQSYNNLAVFYESQGKYEEAESYFLKALSVGGKILGENHPNIARGYNNLARLYSKTDRFDLAKEYQQKSLNIQLLNFGENHPDVAQSYGSLAMFFEREGKYKEALENHYKAREIYLRFLPKEHPSLKYMDDIIKNCEQRINED